MKYIYSNNLSIIRVKAISHNSNTKFLLIEGQNGGTLKRSYFEIENI